jgi:hypothetical protein
VLSSHFSPRAKPQVGHHTACTSLRVGSLIVTTVDDPAIRDEKCSILHIEFGLLLKYRAISLWPSDGHLNVVAAWLQQLSPRLLSGSSKLIEYHPIAERYVAHSEHQLDGFVAESDFLCFFPIFRPRSGRNSFTTLNAALLAMVSPKLMAPSPAEP